MPATKFICKDNTQINIHDCLQSCPHKERCMFLPTLRSIADSLERNLDKPSVTELICGTREAFLKKTVNYAIDPMRQLYALHGSAVHTIQEGHSEGAIITEERLQNNTTSGQFDLYGQILNESEKTLGDYKITSSYKLMKALGYYTTDEPTGEFFKTGAKKGQPKTKKVWHNDGVRYITDWAIQLNYYRVLLEEAGFTIEDMYIQALCRDFSLKIASQRNITKPLYLIKIDRISNNWIKLYMKTKAERLQKAITENKLPEPCSIKERWNNNKCLNYCDVAEFCPFAQQLKLSIQTKP